MLSVGSGIVWKALQAQRIILDEVALEKGPEDCTGFGQWAMTGGKGSFMRTAKAWWLESQSLPRKWVCSGRRGHDGEAGWGRPLGLDQECSELGLLAVGSSLLCEVEKLLRAVVSTFEQVIAEAYEGLLVSPGKRREFLKHTRAEIAVCVCPCLWSGDKLVLSGDSEAEAVFFPSSGLGHLVRAYPAQIHQHELCPLWSPSLHCWSAPLGQRHNSEGSLISVFPSVPQMGLHQWGPEALPRTALCSPPPPVSSGLLDL